MLRTLARRSAGRYRSLRTPVTRQTRAWSTWQVPRPSRSPRSQIRRTVLRLGRHRRSNLHYRG